MYIVLRGSSFSQIKTRPDEAGTAWHVVCFVRCVVWRFSANYSKDHLKHKMVDIVHQAVPH